MTALLATLTALFSSTMGQAGAIALGGMLSAWLLGRFSGSATYKTLRDKSGRQAYRMGILVSKIGNTKLGAVWIPLEDLATDFGAFWVEQFFVGLREDNPVKLEKQLDRLEGVGSETRASAIADKLEVLRASPMQIHDDAAIAFKQAFDHGGDSINQKLSD